MGRIAARWQSWERRGGRYTPASPLSPITYPTTLLREIVEIAPGADLTADPSTWSWVDISPWVRFKAGISTTVGRRDQASVVDPSRASLTIDNRDGRFSRRNPTGPYYGLLTRNTPIRLGVDPGDGMHYRYHGYVNEWPKRWHRSGRDSTVAITCGGALRRLSRGQPLQSALTRAMIGDTAGDFRAVAHWPMEDESGATRLASSLSGQPSALATGDVTLASYDGFAGSLPLPQINNGGRIKAFFPDYTQTGIWQIQHAFRIPSTLSGDGDLIVIKMVPGGTVAQIRLAYDASGPNLRLTTYNSAGTVMDTDNSFVTWDYDTDYIADFTDNVQGGDHLIRFGLWSTITGEQLSSITSLPDGIGAGSTGMPEAITAACSVGTAGMIFGQLALYTDDVLSAPSIGPNARAASGYTGEQAHERMARLCREAGISLRCLAGRSAALGPQASGTLLNGLRDAERADQGVLYEYEFGLGYRAISEIYNQPVALSLDAELGHVGDPPQADDSDLRFRNQWTVSRPGGSSATALDPDYSDMVGLSEGSTSANVETDAQAGHLAAWLVHRDTTDEDYWTGLKLNFGRAPDIIAAWAGLPFGSRLSVANPPAQADPGDIDAIIDGWSERWDPVNWDVTLNTSPASVYQAAVIEGTGGVLSPAWRLEAGSSSLAAAIDSDDTSLSIATASGPLLSTAAADYPCDIGIGGERMTVTAVSGASSPQTVTVVRSVNSIVKSHAAGAAFRGWRLPVFGL